MTVKTYLGDCLEIMKDIPDKSIDMILCDLPYGVLNKGNESAQWDSVIPFEPLWEQYRRICKETMPIVLFGQGMFSAEVMLSNKPMWRYNLIWQKDRPTGFLNANRMPLRSHEDIMVFYDRLPIYNPQMKACKPWERCHAIGNGEHTDRNQQYGDFNRLHQPIIRDEKFPKSVIFVPQEHKCDGKSHPTQKPIELCEYLIKTYTDPGMTVLDNCMGSGTTGIAAIQCGRNFIGIEKDENYYNLAVERIEKAEYKVKTRTTLDSFLVGCNPEQRAI